MILVLKDGSLLKKPLISRLFACIGATIFDTPKNVGYPECT